MKAIIPFYNPTDRVVIKSKGCYQYDSEGRKYIDFESGVWCANLGHSHERVTGIMAQQIEESIHHGYKFKNQHAEQLSVKLQQLTGLDGGASVFLSSGSEAVELAIRLSRHLAGKHKILKIGNSYLSAYGVGKASKDNKDVIEIPMDDMEAIDTINFDDIAAFVMEVGGCSIDMVRVPRQPFIHKIMEACHQHDILVIAEEVTTGMGRMGKWFGFQHYDIKPHMVVTGKALGNGYPVSAVTIDAQTLEAFKRTPFIYAQSHQNDPLGCAVALEVIKVMEDDNLVEACKNMGNYFKKQLDHLKAKHTTKIKEVRGKGLMLAIELTSNVDGESISSNLFQCGFIVGFKANTLRFLPPLVITTKDIDQFIGTLDKLLETA